MAKKNARASEGDSFLFDTKSKAVMAKASHDGTIKEKVKQVQEVVSGFTKDDIYVALEYYEKDVERTIQAFLENGAKEVLDQWTYSGTKPSQKKKKKSKKASDASSQPTPAAAVGAAAAGAAAPAAAAAVVEAAPAEPARALLEDPAVGGHGDHEDVFVSPSTPTDLPTVEGAAKRPKQLEDYQRKVSSSRGRERTVSEQSTSSVTSARGKGPHAGLERSSKDLNRQILSLNRWRTVLTERTETASKDIRRVFQTLTNLLSDREVQMMYELQKAKEQATDILIKRQRLGSELKRRADRAPNMSAQELAELRADIKHFVTERKVDEDVGSSKRFTCDEPQLSEAIKAFGQVPVPKAAHSARRLSSSSSTDPLSPPPMPQRQMEAPPAPAPGPSGAKVLAQSDSLTKYETLNREKLAEPRAPNHSNSEEDNPKSRNARRRLRQREKKREAVSSDAESPTKSASPAKSASPPKTTSPPAKTTPKGPPPAPQTASPPKPPRTASPRKPRRPHIPQEKTNGLPVNGAPAKLNGVPEKQNGVPEKSRMVNGGRTNGVVNGHLPEHEQ